MQVTVFGVRLSPFVEKVVRGLQLKRVPFTLVPPASPFDFKRWSPQTRKMPVLDVDGEKTFDSTLILRRLDALVPTPPFFADDARVAIRQRFVEDWSDESLYWYGMALRWNPANYAATAAQIVGSLPALIRPIAGVLLPRQVAAGAWAQGMVRMPMEVVVSELGNRLDEVLELLGDRPFLFADRPSAADLAIFGQASMLRSGPTPQAEELIAARPALVAYLERVDAATRGVS
jgi:glutathione S-transferase